MNIRKGLTRLVAGMLSLSVFGGTEEFTSSMGGSVVESRHPDARWFYEKGNMGLFLHWDFAALTGLDLSWGMYADFGKLFKDPSMWPLKDVPMEAWSREHYYAFAAAFNPQHYDPDKWMKAAADAGFTYVVLTTRHCDGFAMWPSEVGDLSTKNHMHGRDLVRPYVEAARRHGLKVGFYYSPSDWWFKGESWPNRAYPYADPGFKHLPFLPANKGKLGDKFVKDSPEVLQERFEEFHAYIKAQLTELMTRYGKIDLIWYDGFDWPGCVDIHREEMLDYVASLQPGIIQNCRYYQWENGFANSGGNFQTWENKMPESRPDVAWEHCHPLTQQWAYHPSDESRCRTPAGVMGRYAEVLAWGGNYLPDFGPRPDGEMPASYYALCEALASWRAKNGEAFEGTKPLDTDWHAISNVPLLSSKDGTAWYAVYCDPAVFWGRDWIGKDNVLNEKDYTLEIKTDRTPGSVVLLEDGEALPFELKDGQLTITIAVGRVKRYYAAAVKILW